MRNVVSLSPSPPHLPPPPPPPPRLPAVLHRSALLASLRGRALGRRGAPGDAAAARALPGGRGAASAGRSATGGGGAASHRGGATRSLRVRSRHRARGVAARSHRRGCRCLALRLVVRAPRVACAAGLRYHVSPGAPLTSRAVAHHRGSALERYSSVSRPLVPLPLSPFPLTTPPFPPLASESDPPPATPRQSAAPCVRPVPRSTHAPAAPASVSR